MYLRVAVSPNQARMQQLVVGIHSALGIQIGAFRHASANLLRRQPALLGRTTFLACSSNKALSSCCGLIRKC